MRLSLDAEGWHVETDLAGRLRALLFLVYFERLLVATGGHHARLLCEALDRALRQLLKYEAEEMAATRFLRQTLLRDWLGEMVEARETPWEVETWLVRHREGVLPGGCWYGERTRFEPEVTADPEALRIATTSLVVLYEHAFDLDDLDRSHLLIHGMANLLRFTATHGMPREPGRGATIATLQHFGIERRPEAEVVADLRRFLRD